MFPNYSFAYGDLAFVGCSYLYIIAFDESHNNYLMSVLAYQTLEDRDNPDEIEDNGPYKCRRPNAWLGFGYYFWDSNIQWAHDWGQQSYNNEYIICEASIELTDSCYDLVGCIAHQLEMIEIIGEFKKSGYLSDKGEIYVGQVIELMKNRGIFDYSAIRANDNKKAYDFFFTSNNVENTTLLKRTQICLIDKTNLISRTFRVIHPKHYKLEN